ncbi:MAG TPA: ATP-binding protein, partial [Gaiellaceae bacterium]|nr:ATP-binding protein [Gaiellaceae bacterium]
MHELVQALQYLNLVLFLALAGAGVRLWRRRHDAASFWALAAFAALALVEIVGRLAPDHPHGVGQQALVRLDIAVLLLFPYLIFRFTTGFRPPTLPAARLLGAMTVVMVVWTFAQPSFPAAGEPRPASFVAYLVAFLVHWTVLSAFSSWRLWQAGTTQPSVARRRMKLLAGATATLTVSLFFVAGTSSPDSPLQAAAQALAFAAALAFLLGLAPPQLVRLAWRVPEQRRLQEAIESLVTLATTREEIVGRVLGPMADIVGARGIALRDADGGLLGVHDVAPGMPEEGPDVLHLDVPGGSLTVWTSPYAPFFGEDELQLLETLSALTGIALDRVRLFVREHESRVALERANEVMANFITLAAHELRTPVTAIHGFVNTLNHLGDRLSPERRDEVSRALEQQTARMALLVEQLLDLSRLDADAIGIVPQRFEVRRRIAELVETATPPERAGQVAVDVPEGLEVVADPAAFDRIVSNLVTNAFRYGQPPVVVHADRNDRHFRLWVEDRGRGVPVEFVPDLFERFTRSDSSRERAVGTGLGLAIARAY